MRSTISASSLPAQRGLSRIVPHSPRPGSPACRHQSEPDPRQRELPFSTRSPRDLFEGFELPDGVLPVIKAPSPRLRRLSWPALIKRTFRVDLLACPCGGTRKVVAIVCDPQRIAEVLLRLGIHDLPEGTKAVELQRARAPPFNDAIDGPAGEYADPVYPDDFASV